EKAGAIVRTSGNDSVHLANGRRLPRTVHVIESEPRPVDFRPCIAEWNVGGELLRIVVPAGVEEIRGDTLHLLAVEFIRPRKRSLVGVNETYDDGGLPRPFKALASGEDR